MKNVSIRKTGSIELSAIEHKIVSCDNEEGIFIPFKRNPQIYVGQKKTGEPKVTLDFELKDTPNGHADMLVKAKVTSEGYKRLNLKNADKETWDRYTPILGNVTFDQKEQPQQSQQVQTVETVQTAQPVDDLPPGDFPQELAGGWAESGQGTQMW